MSQTGIALPQDQDTKNNPFKVMAERLASDAMAVLVLADPQEYELAAKRFMQHREVAKKVEEFYDPKVKKAYVPYKALLDERKEVLDVLEASKKHTGRLMTAYEAEQKRLADAENARVEAEQREQARKAEEARQAALKAEEDERLAAAQILQDEGLTEAAEAMLEAPVTVPEPEPTLPTPAPTVAPAVPAVKGMSGRSNWKGRLRPTGGKDWPAEISEEDQLKAMVELCRAVGEGKVPPQMVTLNASAVNKQAGALKQMLGYPGIEVYDDKIRVGRS